MLILNFWNRSKSHSSSRLIAHRFSSTLNVCISGTACPISVRQIWIFMIFWVEFIENVKKDIYFWWFLNWIISHGMPLNCLSVMMIFFSAPGQKSLISLGDGHMKFSLFSIFLSHIMRQSFYFLLGILCLR